MWALNVRGLTRIRGSRCWGASPWVLLPRESRKQLEIDTGASVRGGRKDAHARW